MLLVGVPLAGLLGILEAGKGIAAPISIGGDWTLAIDPAAHCANDSAALLQQQAFGISQSGTQAVITLRDGRATAMDATLAGVSLSARLGGAAIRGEVGGKPSARTLDGQIAIEGCPAAAFHALRQPAKKGGI